LGGTTKKVTEMGEDFGMAHQAMLTKKFAPCFQTGGADVWAQSGSINGYPLVI